MIIFNKMDRQQSLEILNSYNKNTLMETLQIEFVDVGKDFITAKMPVNSKVHQPHGILHGGATAALAETVGSCASGFFLNDNSKIVKGIELSINHVKSKKDGTVFATAKAVHQGRTTHLWEVKIVDEQKKLISLCKITNIVLDKK
ncbi:putative esterase VC_A0580 [Tenacibaculum dicentrarchi]|uniref:Esterase VC_A0580 n=2 Tax=Tenacibaculum dicentrarchi TaxID=669041 RepID=A0ABP1EG86_9FLAO|nr:putative esterase VC_A0580 [Tenacibaculum dicentrarchi]SOS54344.1 putative esterase VC_A0580 [Tenacibaculum dicentrarchi]SOU86673.1 putative esterase VC_A0580 [Tenacibaculum dicentrarchi]